MEPEFLDFTESDQMILEKEPLERVASICAERVEAEGFWYHGLS